MYKDLRFFGHYIHDVAGIERAQAIVRQEMQERQPDKLSPSGYVADDSFKKEVSRFGTAYRELAADTLQRARAGEKISRDEYVTIVRGERLNAEASAIGPSVAEGRLRLLEAGKHAFQGTGRSDARVLGQITGYDRDDGPRERFSVSVDHGFKK